MAVPKYDEMYNPFLEALKDGRPHPYSDVKNMVISHFGLTNEDLKEMIPSGRQSIFLNRIGWTRTYLKKAGLIDSPSRAVFQITDKGKKALADKPDGIDNKYLMQYESFRAFQNLSASNTSSGSGSLPAMPEQNDTPDVLLEKSYAAINEGLASDVLSEVMKIKPKTFEKMVTDLFAKMYGTSANAGYTTSYTGDEGIDGVVREDKLGFNLIYIQAKQWALDKTVSRPDIQGFVGAIAGKGGKGLFVTTAKFSKQASDYAEKMHIILVDGEQLANLMIENNFCVSVKKTYEIKAIDSDAFNDYQEMETPD